MKNLLILTTYFFSTLFANTNTSETFSRDRLVEFYDVFLLEEKDILATVGLTTGSNTNNRDPFTPPPNPPPPPFKTNLLPVVLVNDSGLPDADVYVLVTTGAETNGTQYWGSVNTSPGSNFGVVSYVTVSGQNGSTYTVSLSQLPVGSTGRVLYLPAISGGIIWFSMGSALNMPSTGNAITQPNFTNPTDPNYNINYDIFELAYVPTGSPAVACDATAVSFFSIPLYGYLAGATSEASNTGLYQPRSYIMAQAAAMLNSTVENAQWNKLLLQNGSTIVRLLSTGKSISTTTEFDVNYLDNPGAYGYSYIGDIWDGGTSAYYHMNPLNITVTVTNPPANAGTWTYAGNVPTTGPNTGKLVFMAVTGGAPATMSFPVPSTSTTPPGTDSFQIFSGINFNSTASPTAGDVNDALSKLVQEAIIAGLLPTTNMVDLTYLADNQANFYTVNSNLSSTGQSKGPWYDVYSKALHSLGSIYTYAFDEPLWPNVLLSSPFTNNQTYIGITINSVQ